MLVIRIELWPFGDKSRARTLHTAVIANDGSGGMTTGNYDVVLMAKNKRPWKKGRVEGFPRTRLGCWDLLYRGLAALVGSRNGAKTKAPRTKENTQPCCGTPELLGMPPTTKEPQG